MAKAFTYIILTSVKQEVNTKHHSEATAHFEEW